MGLEYIKARQLALRRVYPDSFVDEEEISPMAVKIPKPLSAPASPSIRNAINGYFDNQDDDEEDENLIPLPRKQFPALRKDENQPSREEELLREGDIKTLNKLALEEKTLRHP